MKFHKCMKNITEPDAKNDPNKHGGKIRSFPHERGVWATYVYIQYKPPEEFLEMVEELKKVSESHGIILNTVEDFHISLSRTVKLRHHWIPLFVDSLKAHLSYFSRFKVALQSLDVYENEEKTRTFLGLKAHTGFEKLEKIADKVDSCLLEFKLPTFYQNPSFHLSCASCIGSKTEEIEKILADLNVVFQLFLNSHSKCNQIWVTKICCKSGNKLFTFSLK
ncbi:U6 snRNA phosphodiesterase 1-like isoform X2 [Uloborus diversus]|nr:U6 snRNA phosphodiesterase 1-like isoform X2 [Uloborus diversus]